MGKGGRHRESFGVGTLTIMGAGTLLGMGTDAMWYSMGLPGSTTPLAGCSIINQADIVQLAVAGGLTFLGFFAGFKSLPPLTFGMMIGMLIPKLISPMMGWPRYILFNYDPTTGSLTPIGRAPPTPVAPVPPAKKA